MQISTAVPGAPVSLPTPSPSSVRDGNAFVVLTKEVLGHIYSSNSSYHSRILGGYYHPNLTVYSDPMVTVEGRDNMRRILAFYFAWFVKSMTVDVRHVSSTIGSVVIAGQRRQGATIMADHVIHIKELTFLGRLLNFLHLLPPATYLGGSTREGLRVISRLVWIADPQAPVSVSAAFEDRGYIVQHEDVYSSSGLLSSMLLYPVYWALCYLQMVSTLLSGIVRWADSTLRQNFRVKIKSRQLEGITSGSYDLLMKQPIGWLLADFLLGKVEQLRFVNTGDSQLKEAKQDQ